MKFHAPLVKGTLVKRYKRFMADVTLEDGTVVTAHCANSGSMLSVNEPAAEVWISPAANPDRKLKWTWELIRIGKTLVGINTALPNAIVAEAIEAGKVAELTGYETLRREVKYGQNSCIDILLEDPKKGLCYVEIKNVTMRRDLADGPLEFPDGVTSRGAKHLVELADMVYSFLFVQRRDRPGLCGRSGRGAHERGRGPVLPLQGDAQGHFTEQPRADRAVTAHAELVAPGEKV